MDGSPVRRPTIAVLSTAFGGAYFGGILGGIVGAVAAADGRLIAIQTLDAGTFDRDLAEPPGFAHQVAWRHISAFAVILNAVDHEYLTAIRAAGKPVVMISDNLPGFTSPVVLPDNRTGVKQAVEHLLDHGHREIAFAGFPAQRDFVERFQAYQRTLVEHGIDPDPRLVFDTGNNQVCGGETAARAMIEAGLPCTAVVTGNDLNAIGLTNVLTAAGYEIPRDLAVIGFDDMDAATYRSPSLSSVRQRLDVIGATAVGLLLEQLAGREVADGFHYVPTELVVRQSCGCPSTLTLAGDPASEPPPVRSRDELATRLAAAVCSDGSLFGAAARTVVRDAADVLGDVVAAAVAGSDGPTDRDLQRALAGLYSLKPQPESMVKAARCVRWYARHVAETTVAPGDEAARRRVEDCVQETVLALAQTQARARFAEAAHFEATFDVQHAVSMGLLRSSHEEDPRTLDWLEQTPARAACLGLWRRRDPEDDVPPSLEIAGAFFPDEPRPEACAAGGGADGGGADGGGADGGAGAASGTGAENRSRRGESPIPMGPVAVDAFPPSKIVARASLARDEMVFIAPMKVNASDWGMLAVVGPIEAGVSTGREVMNQWAALLTIALDHGAVLKSLRTREEQLRHAALYDELTGLPNRALFMDRLAYSIGRAKRHADYRYGVFLLDLDGFKVVNDSLGHLTGDRLLVEAGRRIRGSLRSTDVAARFGGDEFAVLLDDLAGEDGAAVVAARLQTVLAHPCVLDGQEVVVSASIGVALSGDGYDQPEDVIRDADIAMYFAKSREKGTHAIFDVEMHARAVGRLRIESELRRAVDNGELELFYQPIVDLRRGTTAAFEALIRWQHPERGVLGPAEFLAIAEECGLMLPIGRWVISQACRQLAEWRSSGLGHDVTMSVNISNRQFWSGRLVEDVDTCLREARLEPRSLDMEITEGIIMHDVKLARRELAELHDCGVGLHIDDFGTGYSSLEALHYLPIDALKIDRSFVAQLGADDRCEELIRAIIAMGTSLGLELIAEGVETAAHRDQLHTLGCRYGQGFWFSRPVPAPQATALIQADPPGAQAA